MNWLLALIFNWIAKRLGYVPAPKPSDPLDIAKEQVKIEPEQIKIGGNPSSETPAAESAHGPR